MSRSGSLASKGELGESSSPAVPWGRSTSPLRNAPHQAQLGADEEEAALADENVRMAAIVGQSWAAQKPQVAAKTQSGTLSAGRGNAGESAQARVRREATEAYAKMRQLPDIEDEEEMAVAAAPRRDVNAATAAPPAVASSVRSTTPPPTGGARSPGSPTEDEIFAEERAFQRRVEAVHAARMRQEAREGGGAQEASSTSRMQQKSLEGFLNDLTVSGQAEEDVAVRNAHQKSIAAKAAHLESRLWGQELSAGSGAGESSYSWQTASRDQDGRIVLDRAYNASNDSGGSGFGEADLTVSSVERQLADLRARKAARESS